MKSIGKLFIWQLSSMNKISRSSKVFNSTNYTAALEKNLGILSGSLKFKSKVPQEPVPNNLTDSAQPERIKVDKKTIELLERLSLVKLDDREAINTLEDAIVFAGHVLSINTEDVKPLCTVLEDRHLRLRSDEVTDGNIKDDVISNASLTEEEYFVAPPGNIPLEARQDLLYEKETANSYKIPPS